MYQNIFCVSENTNDLLSFDTEVDESCFEYRNIVGKKI